MSWLWHRFVLRHQVKKLGKIEPDEVMRSKDGKPLINVYVQDQFRPPMKHRECSCGRTWI